MLNTKGVGYVLRLHFDSHHHQPLPQLTVTAESVNPGHRKPMAYGDLGLRIHTLHVKHISSLEVYSVRSPTVRVRHFQ